MPKIVHVLEGKSPAGGSIRCEIFAGGKKVRIVHTKKGIENVVDLDASTVGVMVRLLELARSDATAKRKAKRA